MEVYENNKSLIIGGIIGVIFIIICVIIYYKFRPVKCQVSNWSEWSTCTATCGGGVQSRSRTVIKKSSNGGTACPTLTESRTCNSQACVVNCQVSDWSEWGTCSKTCGGGTQSRTRTIIKPAENGGIACPIDLSENRLCNCQACPVNCEVSKWSDWSTCSKTCGGGIQTRSRTIIKQAANGGTACPIDLSENRICNNQGCPVNCEVSDWSDWGACSAECAGGTRTRTRTIKIPAANGGTACPVLTDTSTCNAQVCPNISATSILQVSNQTLLGPVRNLFDNIVYQNNMWETGMNTYNNGIVVIDASNNQPSILAKNNIRYYGHYVMAQYPYPYVLTSYEFYHNGNGNGTNPATQIVGSLPQKWAILGSNDNQTWELVHNVDLFVNYSLNTPAKFNIPTREAYRVYALLVYQVTSFGNRLNLGGWKLYGYQQLSGITNCTSNPCQVRVYPPVRAATNNIYNVRNQAYGNGTYIIYASSSQEPITDAYRIFDARPNAIWSSSIRYNRDGSYFGDVTFNQLKGEWIKIKLPVQISLQSYYITPRLDNNLFTKRSPVEFILYGTNDELTWYVLDNRTNLNKFTNWTANKQLFAINNRTKYTTYLLHVLKTNGDNSVNITNLEFYGYE